MSEINNPYAAPESNPESPNNFNMDTASLASRGSRFGASLLDGIIMSLSIVPLMFAFGYFDYIQAGVVPPVAESLGYSLAAILIFFAINFKFLLSDGQTIGKKITKIKIVGMDNTKADAPMIFKRYGFYFLLGQIPVVGNFASLVNVLFIFRQDKRCIHDHVAGTKVIEAQSLVS